MKPRQKSPRLLPDTSHHARALAQANMDMLKGNPAYAARLARLARHNPIPIPNLPALPKGRLPDLYIEAKSALEKCVRVDECKDWADKMAALASYAKQSQDDELYKMCERIHVRAFKRCGELLKQIESATGKHRKSTATDTLSRKDAATEAGLSKRQKDDALRIASVPDREFEDAVESDDPPTRTDMAKRGTKPRATVQKKRRLYPQAATGDRIARALMEIENVTVDLAHLFQRPEVAKDGRLSDWIARMEECHTKLSQTIDKARTTAGFGPPFDDASDEPVVH